MLQLLFYPPLFFLLFCLFPLTPACFLLFRLPLHIRIHCWSGARTTSRGASNAPAGTTIYNHIHSQVNGGDNMTVFMNGEAKDQRNAAQRGVDLDPDLSDKDARIVRSLFDELMDKNVNSKNTNSSAPAGNGASSSSSIPAKPDSASLAVDKNQEGQRKSADFNFTWRFDQAVSNPHNKVVTKQNKQY